MSHSPVSGDTPDSGSATPSPQVGMPRWVKVFLIAAAALVLLLVTLMLLTGGQHGPGRHVSSTASPDTTLLVALRDAAIGDAR